MNLGRGNQGKIPEVLWHWHVPGARIRFRPYRIRLAR